MTKRIELPIYIIEALHIATKNHIQDEPDMRLVAVIRYVNSNYLPRCKQWLRDARNIQKVVDVLYNGVQFEQEKNYIDKATAIQKLMNGTALTAHINYINHPEAKTEWIFYHDGHFYAYPRGLVTTADKIRGYKFDLIVTDMFKFEDVNTPQYEQDHLEAIIRNHGVYF